MVNRVEEENSEEGLGIRNFVDVAYDMHEELVDDLSGGDGSQAEDVEPPIFLEPDLGKRLAELLALCGQCSLMGLNSQVPFIGQYEIVEMVNLIEFSVVYLGDLWFPEKDMVLQRLCLKLETTTIKDKDMFASGIGNTDAGFVMGAGKLLKNNGYEWKKLKGKKLEERKLKKMGGGGEIVASKATLEKDRGCFSCGKLDHWIQNCPWSSSPCKRCDVGRVVRTSQQQPHSFGEKFLSCPKPKVRGFQWMKDARRSQSSNKLGNNLVSCYRRWGSSYVGSSNGKWRVSIEIEMDNLCDGFEANVFVKGKEKG
ncbi:hypothetical protein IFM89_002024 [Coptis chinensis]|uniref:CCHC-type domain-containing protein n=1 Tax=Coptis chinensis TaxID=261450 RepID=A0A835HKG8_9MAGN|nr:hypothetical protein IFM89_002024 [Coptis chinensis]